MNFEKDIFVEITALRTTALSGNISNEVPVIIENQIPSQKLSKISTLIQESGQKNNYIYKLI